MNYILYGELYPMIRKHLNKILKERLGETDDFNVTKIDFEESNLDEIAYESSTLPLGYDKKAVVVDNAIFLTKDVEKNDEEKVIEILEKSSDDIDLIFVLRSDKVNKSGKIFNFVKENGQVFEFLNIEKEQWPLYIRKYFANKNVEITSEAINELSARVDGDLTRFINEADKLCLYKNPITLSDVVLMVAKPLEDDAFQMSNALFRGENDLAISIYRDIKLMDSRSADALIPMLASQFRFISQVLYLDSRGLEKEEIASQLGVNPVRVKMSLKNARNISRKAIANALDKFYNLDFQTKSGQIDRSYGFELFLINFPN